ncbi:MAG: GAF domain-containing sensor histidine kinase, partial [Chloroflexi bacterium]|nr:GAF domain-containing sensor histidine kinase [Chloroflexota bacterium]
VIVGAAIFSVIVFGILGRIQRRLLERNQQIAAVQTASVSLASDMTLEPLLQRFVDLARAITNARYAALAIAAGGGAIELFITSGISKEERDRMGALPTGRGLLGIIHEGTVVRLRDLTSDPRSAGFPPGHPRMRSLLGVPVVYRREIVGRLYLTEKQGAAEFTHEDEELVTLLAAQAAASIENARLLQQSQDLAILEERERIGMDLHDGVIQALYGVGLSLEECADVVSEEPEFVSRRLDKAVNDLNQVIRDIRCYIFHLRPAAFSSKNLEEALFDLAREVQINSLVDIEVKIEQVDAASLPDELAENLFHIVQEALANVSKHARASRAAVELIGDGEAYALTVTDNGRGFEMNTRRGVGHRGLGNIADRARTIDATLKIESSPGAGTSIRIGGRRDACHSKSA